MLLQAYQTDGQAADAIYADTLVKMEIAPRLLRNPKSERPDFWIQSWSNVEDPVVLFERNLYGHPLKGLFFEKTVRGSSAGAWMGKSTELTVPICSSKTRIILLGSRG